MTATSAAVHRVRDLVRAALVGTSIAPQLAVSDADLVAAVSRHRVAELLAAHADGLGLSREMSAALDRMAGATRRGAMLQTLELARVTGLLAVAGIPHLSIKGPALAVQTTGSVSARGAGDLDLLVPPDRVEETHRLLTDAGWQLRESNRVDPGTWAWRHVLRAFNAFSYDGAGSSIDLHWRLDPSPTGLPGFDELWARRVGVELPGLRVDTLSVADALMHGCFHAAKDGHRWLRSLVDVHRLAASPSAWDGRTGLTSLEAGTLAVTRSAIGLPAGLPPAVVATIDRVPNSRIARALLRQEQPVRAAFPFPGAESARLMSYLVRASPAASGVSHALLATALPVQTVVGVDAPSPWTGVPRVLAGRVGRARRRTVAWSRRVPGAGVEVHR